MIHKIALLLIIIGTLFAKTPEQLFEEGNYAMVEQNYKNAIQSYESILELGFESGELYYNLGNAYYRVNYIGLATWAYYNALSMRPRDKDTMHNLNVTQARQLDRIEMPKPFILLDFYRKLKGSFTFQEFIYFGGALLMIESLVVLLIQFGWVSGFFYRYIVTFFLFLILGIHGISVDKYFDDWGSKYSIITANGVNSYSGPFSDENTILFRINEGMKVEVNKVQDNWIEIILIDGKKGWITEESMRTLR